MPCRPRETVVPLLASQDEAALLLIPDVALVKRCGGYCGVAVTCVPDKVRTIKRRVSY